MLGAAQFYANLKAPDLDAVRDFYEGKLGLPFVERREVMPGHEEIVFAAGDARICIEQGTPAPNPGTPIGWAVDNVPAAVERLRANGIVFEEYDLPYLKTTDGIATVGIYMAAWFKDPGGNTLGVFARAPVVGGAQQEMAEAATS
jgi:catechol 2,3-dioxygenase-like lactoylglutathione lyase family enzyme